MSLKTATVIVIICIITHLVLSAFWLLNNKMISETVRNYALLVTVFSLLNTVILNGGFILFFVTLYSKQKK